MSKKDSTDMLAWSAVCSGIIWCLLIIGILMLTGCSFRPTEVVTTPDAPVLISDIRGHYAEVWAWSKKHNSMIRVGWVDLEKYEGWTLTNYDWTEHSNR